MRPKSKIEPNQFHIPKPEIHAWGEIILTPVPAGPETAPLPSLLAASASWSLLIETTSAVVHAHLYKLRGKKTKRTVGSKPIVEPATTICLLLQGNAVGCLRSLKRLHTRISILAAIEGYCATAVGAHLRACVYIHARIVG
jgi:hypothetical protein